MMLMLMLLLLMLLMVVMLLFRRGPLERESEGGAAARGTSPYGY